jgi:hypothetical protein
MMSGVSSITRRANSRQRRGTAPPPRAERSVSREQRWKSEHIHADDPFARFAAMAQGILVRRMIAANRTHWRKYDEAQSRKREARELAQHNLKGQITTRRDDAPHSTL